LIDIDVSESQSVIGNQTSVGNEAVNIEAGFYYVLNSSIVIARALHRILVPWYSRHNAEGVLAL